MKITICYKKEQELEVKPGSNILQVINKSNILQEYPEIDLKINKVGIFGEICDLNKIVNENDRVEIYQPLKINPKDARRERAKK